MQFLRTNTAVIVAVGPFLDATDGVTLKTGLTITNERITLSADTDAGSAPTLILDNITGATSATSNDLNYITGQDNAMMQIELSAANVNRFGRMTLTITDSANHVPVIHDYIVLPAVIYDSFILGTDRLEVDMEEIGNNIITNASIDPGAEIDIANAVWDALTASHTTAATFGLAVASGASPSTIAGAVWNEARSGHVGAGSFGEGVKVAASGIPVGAFATGAITNAALATDTGLKPHQTGTAQAGTSTSISLNVGASAIDDFYIYQLVKIESGTGVGQSRMIMGYNGSTKVATVFPNFATTPDNTSVYTILASGIISAATPPTAIENADALLNRDMSAVTVTHTRSPINALRFNRNKFTLDKTTGALVVYAEDDTTPAWTGIITPAASIDSINVDPA